ncbi:MAG: radical SAM protein [Clostridiales Family XIII bacterium]|jgi:nitrogen fixation protein NifB|nr:radical SAM protein [Clostridiales Family XIII bacterium]
MRIAELEVGKHRRDVVNQHPCFGAVRNKARMHLPICPSCNIECAFCRRSLNDDENRPGVSAFILPVDEVSEYVDYALKACDALSVIGVAGPGDTLVGDNLFKAFLRLNETHPDLLKCMSTNGLLLNERADELIEIGIDTLTVTVNAVDPHVLKQIVPAIHYHGERIEGARGARILIRNQIAGITKMAEAGTTIKVNTVLVPGVNDSHVENVAEAVRKAGASIFNIIPLIPQHLLSNIAEPSCGEIEAARAAAAKHIDVFRHCQRCRADAIGIPGLEDHASTVLGKYYGKVEEVFSHG